MLLENLKYIYTQINFNKYSDALDDSIEPKLIRRTVLVFYFFICQKYYLYKNLKRHIFKKTLNFFSGGGGTNKIIINYVQLYNLLLTRKFKFYDFTTILIFNLNFKKTKPFYSLFFKKRLIFGMSLGAFLKRIYIFKKNLRKSFKTNILILKVLLARINASTQYFNKLLMNIVGTKKRIYRVLNFLKKRLKCDNLWMVYSPFLYRYTIKIKKVRSIKKKFRKKIRKL